MVEKMVELRRGKMTADECRAALSKGNYFGTMLVKLGVADALLGRRDLLDRRYGSPRAADRQDQARQ